MVAFITVSSHLSSLIPPPHSISFDFLNFSLHQQVLGAATSVAKHTSALCNACKAASAKTNNPAAKRQFVQAAKDVANNTANLVKNIKVSFICIEIQY